ncbi:MAG: hypothetical protein IJO96_01335 [Oscillospiraceae bacterium]|nr:hypothetical protein [Oscillospiraceae bacterium]
MATGVTNYQCPACTGPLHFVGDSGKLECDYCGSKYEVAEIEKLFADDEAASLEAQKAAEANPEESCWSAEELNGMKVYNCSSCGAELICDATTAATSCPSCGNPTIMPSQFAGGLKPDLIIPFKLSKEDAVAALKKFYKGKKFLPKSFCDQNHIEEIKGVYVPFWLCDCQVSGVAEYEGTTKRVYKSGEYEVTETSHYNVVRGGNIGFKKIPADASTKMPDNHMDAIEPYDYSEFKPFSSAYLPGFLADKYDVDKETTMPRIEERAKNSFAEELRKTVVDYDSVTNGREDFNIDSADMKYALLPVWMLSTKWKDKNFLFAMNGQTGKLVGELPVDKGKYFAWFAGIAVPLMIILGLLFL